MEGKGLAEVVHLAKEDEEEAITELLRLHILRKNS